MGQCVTLVLEAGLEPAQPQWPRDFKSLVSTIPPFEQTGYAAAKLRKMSLLYKKGPKNLRKLFYYMGNVKKFVTLQS